MNKNYTVAFHTLGCKVSQYETEAIREALLSRGFTETPFDESADVYIINTCTVTAESDRKSRQMIRRARAKNPDAAVVVTGCYSEVSPDECAAIEGVTHIFGSYGKMKIPDAVEAYLSLRENGKTPPQYRDASDLDTAPFEKMCVRGAPRTRAYVKIEDGCECRCTYCAIPAARGRVRSKAPEDVLAELRILSENGTREVVLTGIETASYGRDLGDVSLIDLLERIDRELPTLRVRLGSLTPELVTEDFVLRAAQLKILLPHFHLSMQSGSDSVLRLMRRRYNTRQALLGFELLREKFPDVQLTTDMMVGFPGESDANFEETLDFVSRARFLQMHVFIYSERKGTVAATMEGAVPKEVRKERSQHLIALGKKITSEILSEAVEKGKPLSAIFETYDGKTAVGHSASFIEVRVETSRDLRGEVVEVTPVAVGDGYLICK